MAHRQKVHEEIELLIAEHWSAGRGSALRRGFRPNLDSYHTDVPHELTVVVELPGVSPRSLVVAVSERVLVIAGERVRAKARGRVYQQMEIEYGPFERRVRLAEDVDAERARSRFEDGLLTISLPVAGTPQPRASRTIVVEGGG
jgi:HSP20 family protein